MKFAVIKTGGKQYLAKEGQSLNVEKLAVKEGESVELPTLLVADGDKLEIGKPELMTKVKAKVLTHGRAEKVTIIKFKPKVRYRRKQGHRQPFTKILIEKI